MKGKFFNVIPGEGGSATLLLYGDIGDGDKVESGRIVSELMSLSAEYGKIDIRINSRGGDVFSGMSIYHALRNSKSDITIYVDGLAASMAAIIALCGKPLLMSPYARLMLHRVNGGIYGDSCALRETAKQMDDLQKDLATMISGRCGLPSAAVEEKYFDGKDHWIDSSEALSMGLCDGIYDMTPPAAAPQTPEDIYSYFNNRLKEPQTDNEMALIDDIKAIPSFGDKEDASAIVAHIKALESKATSADALKRANDAYKTQIETLQKKEVETFLNMAVSDGKIRKEQIPAMTKLMMSDRASAEELINSMKPSTSPLRAVDFISGGSGGNSLYANKSWDELDSENLLAGLKEHDKALFCEKFKEKFHTDYVD